MREVVMVPQVLTTTCPFGCLPFPFGTFTGNTERDLIAAICNHVIQVHHGGSRDAWEAAELRFPYECRAWGEEVRAEADRP